MKREHGNGKHPNHYRSKGKRTPALSRKILHIDVDGEHMKAEWKYARIIGRLDFFEKFTRPDIAYAVHQSARFTSNPKASHNLAV